MTANIVEAQSVEDSEISKKGKELAEIVIRMVYGKWKSVWKSHLNPETNDNYKEIPKKSKPNKEVLKKVGIIDKIILGIRVTFQSRSQTSNQENMTENKQNTWGIVIQREKDGSATIFYAGVIPGSNEFRHKPGLKVIHAERGGKLLFGYFEFDFDGSQLLSTSIHDSSIGNRQWLYQLKEFDLIDQESQSDIAACLSHGGDGVTTVLDELDKDFILRQEGFASHSISDYQLVTAEDEKR